MSTFIKIESDNSFGRKLAINVSSIVSVEVPAENKDYYQTCLCLLDGRKILLKEPWEDFLNRCCDL